MIGAENLVQYLPYNKYLIVVFGIYKYLIKYILSICSIITTISVDNSIVVVNICKYFIYLFLIRNHHKLYINI
jgi:hypothetical protein